MKLNNKIKLHFVAPWVYVDRGFLNKNSFYSFLGAILASSLLFVFSCSKGGGKYTLTVNEIESGTLTSEPEGINCGSKGKDCEAQFDEGTEITLTAETDAGYTAGIWGEACEDVDAKEACTLIMDSDKIVTKAFNDSGKRSIIISGSPTNGTVTSKPPGISCGGRIKECTAQFEYKTNVILKATPEAGYAAGAWGEACADVTDAGATCTVNMDADKIVSKTFLVIQYILNVDKPAGGTITSDIGDINCGSKGNVCRANFPYGKRVTFTATPGTDYELGAWGQACVSVIDAGLKCTVNMGSDKTVSKVFTTIQHTLTITKPTGGNITSKPKGINCGRRGKACKAKIDKNMEVTLTATAATGYNLGDWGGNCSGSGSDDCSLTIDDDKAVSLTFPIKQYTLTIDPKPANGTVTSNVGSINCGSGGNVCNAANLNHGTSVTLTAAADMNYELGAWNGGGCSSSDATCTLTMNGNQTVSKNFPMQGSMVVAVDTDGDGVDDVDDVDDDNNGLIEVHDLDMFDHIRHNLAGTSYKNSGSASDDRMGAPEAETDDCTTAIMDGSKSFFLCGYELARDLDFAQAGSYEGSSVNDNWRPLDSSSHAIAAKDAVNAGFDGIDNFAGIFDGKGYSISNLYSRGDDWVGLFKKITADATIRSLGVVDANLYVATSDTSTDQIAALVGKNQGNIIASYAKGGSVNNLNSDGVGGLVGNNDGKIIACYAAEVTINAGISKGARDVGGFLGGLAYNNSRAGRIIASYATGAANGGPGNDQIGGLVAYNWGHITASYANVNIDGDSGTDNVGVVVSIQFAGKIVNTYGFGSLANEEKVDTHGAPGSRTVNGLDLSSAGSKWNAAASKTKGAWDFGTGSQPPALKYADYDGAAGVSYCALFPARACGTLLPRQRS